MWRQGRGREWRGCCREREKERVCALERERARARERERAPARERERAGKRDHMHMAHAELDAIPARVLNRPRKTDQAKP